MILAAAPLLLIGVDGFRHDYTAIHHAPRIAAMARTGASAKALVPCFPSTTFPNFYSIATGLRPEQHGVLDMDFHDPARGKRFYYRDSASTADPAWWGGTPIWVLAERHDVRAATYFWPGTDVPIQGTRPTHFRRYDPAVTRDQKVKQALEWMRLPEAERPKLVIVYFSDVDAAGHVHGPLSAQVREAVTNVDRSVGELLDGAPHDVNVVLVSDHGMSAIEKNVDLGPLADFSGFHITNALELVQLYSKDAALVDRTYAALRGKSPLWSVHRGREILPHPSAGDLIIVPRRPVMIGVNEKFPALRGMHGYDPKRNPEMHGVLFAQGPAFRAGARTGEVVNTTLYAMFARILGLPTDQPLARALRRLLR